MLGFLFIWTGCSNPKHEIQLTGLTMGTTYSIKITDPPRHLDIKFLQGAIDSILISINESMSNWDPSSEISNFNNSSSTDPFSISSHFRNVVETSLDISIKTDGAYDVTIYDLLSIWGFGPDPKQETPTKIEISSVLNYTGYGLIELKENQLYKSDPRVKLDLNSIAKGYGVDVVFEYLESKGLKDLFVEIGGEVRCIGNNAQDSRWAIGVEDPPRENLQQYAGIIRPESGSVATSGNYRNYVDINGKILGHTIHPKTGYPIRSDILSVSVKTKSCMVADGWATALMVLDLKSGLEIVENQSGLEAMWILDNGDGSREIVQTGGFTIEDEIYEIRK